MGDKQLEELMGSLKSLYISEEYSDLTITCREKNYRVHKAIVCPRSKFFTNSEAARKGTINLLDDDPRAVGMVIHYLYHLDYSSAPTRLEDKAASTTSYGNGTHTESEGHWKTNRHDGQALEDPAQEVMSETTEGATPLESLDDSIHNAALKSGKGRKRKKKRASIQSPTDGTEPKDLHAEETEMIDDLAAEEALPPAPEESPTYGNLLIHAKVYTLSKRYEIKGLKALALEKFEDEAKQKWVGDDFLQAAKEVYTSTLDEDDKDIRDVITGKFCEHPELLDERKTAKVIRGLDLAFDLLKRVRINGGFGDN